MGLYLGIDFGTSTTYVTRWNEEKRRPEAVSNLGNNYGESDVFPNVIYYNSASDQLIGSPAQRKGSVDQLNYVTAIKRRLEERNYKRYLPNVGRELTAVEIARDCFACLKRKVESNFGGEKISGVVISVPFAFQHNERGRIQRAAELAGLNVLGLIEEPVAAALSFGLMQQAQPGKCEKVLVFDLGGGTFDVAAFKFVKQAEDRFAIQVMGTDGNKHLGGIDIDDEIAVEIQETLEMEHPDYRLDALDEKHLAAEKSRFIDMARQIKENVAMYGDDSPFFPSTVNDDIQYEKDWQETDLDNVLEHGGFMTDVADVLDHILFDLDLNKDDIDRVIMVGGTTQIPSIQHMAEEYFGRKPEVVDKPDEMVGRGAGIYCGILLDKKIRISISLCLSKAIGIRQNGQFKELLRRNARYETMSEVIPLAIGHKAADKKIQICQGDGAKQEELSVLTIPQAKVEQANGRLGLALGTDKNGMVKYAVYDMGTDKGTVMMEGMLEVE
ncbi:MAG: Hsp70 family protein [Candidatus Cryptobacteroides sp.]|nr:Hsp70 family protein [Candidatus Cryptobacteroides sp.]